MATTLDIDDLKKLYAEGDSIDEELFAEQRSNVLLCAGEHYTKRGSKFYNRLRDTKTLDHEQRIRLTKNHIYKITKKYQNSIINLAPDVTPMPVNENDLQDTKAAELHKKVKKYLSTKLRMKEKRRKFVGDFVDIGEVAAKVTYDKSAGEVKGYNQLLDDKGEPVFDEQGAPEQDPESPVFSGKFIIEPLYGYNLLREASAKSLEENQIWHIRKMVNVAEMKKRYKKEPDKAKMFERSSDRTYLIFDSASSQFQSISSKDQCMVVETYCKPCFKYPNGYFYFWTDEGIFEEDVLPFGIYPIVFASFDEVQNSPRGRSVIKVLRPFQVEINRAASKVAEHQITLGDDKVIYSEGATFTPGQAMPGVRGYKISGPPPTILAGRDGGQYIGYMEKEILGMYRASLVSELDEDKATQLDAYSLLFRAASEKVKFSLYTEKFEQFQADLWNVILEYARHYLSDEELIEAVGKYETGSIDEFRNPANLGYIIQLEPQTEDLETRLGKQLTANHLIQFAGDKLTKEDLGRVVRGMPFGNLGQDMGDLTLNYDVATNMLLALDRGEQPMAHKNDPHPYMISKLTNRQRKPDYKLLNPQIQANYDMQVKQHEGMEAEVQAKILATKNDMIPTGGAMIVCDMYVPDPKNPTGSRRVKVPYEALDWLLKRMEKQGSSMSSLDVMHAQNLTNIAQMAHERVASGQVQPIRPGMPGASPPQGSPATTGMPKQPMSPMGAPQQPMGAPPMGMMQPTPRFGG